jgi:acyl dehydratase
VGQMIDFESLDKGSPLDGISIPALTRTTLARFAGAVDDYNPMHLDDKVATAAGKSSVFAPANLVMAQIGRMVQSFFAGTSIRRYSLRMLKLVWPGDVLTCRGVVIDKREDGKEYVIDADVWADNQRGETVAKGRVIAVVPRDPETPLSRGAQSVGLVYPVYDANSTAATKKSTKKTTKKTKKKSSKR